MTQQEASEHYNIPVSILQEYKSWGLCDAVKKVMGVWQYDDEDQERLSIILTLHDIGFTSEEAETYMRLLLEQPDSTKKRQMVNQLNLNSVLGSHAINQEVGCYSYRSTHWLDTELTAERFFEMLDRCADEADRGYIRLKAG